MITTLYKDNGGKAEFDIIATRDADLTEANQAMHTATAGPGALRLLAAVRASHLLQVAQDRIRRAPANTADFFAYTSPELGTVHVVWAEAAA